MALLDGVTHGVFWFGFLASLLLFEATFLEVFMSEDHLKVLCDWDGDD